MSLVVCPTVPTGDTYARLSTFCTGPFSGLLQEVAIWKILKASILTHYICRPIFPRT